MTMLVTSIYILSNIMYYGIKFYPKDNTVIFTNHKNVWEAKSEHFRISLIALRITFLSCTFKRRYCNYIITILCIT